MFYLWLNHLNNDACFAFSAHFIFCLSVFCGTSIPNPDFHMEAEDVLGYIQPEPQPICKVTAVGLVWQKKGES